MDDSRGVLIVSASTGTGHVRAGDALREAFAARSPSAPVEHVDLLDLAPAWVRVVYGRGYEIVSTHTPWLWRGIYHWTDAPDADLARWGPVAHRVLFREFRRYLLSKPWGVCLCTHFLPGQLAAGMPGLPPFAMVITDLTLHRFWAQPRIRRFYAGCEELRAELQPRVPGARIEATGIPVASRFRSPPPRAAARASLGLDPDRPVVLVMGGGLGVGIEATAAAVARARVEGMQVLAVCGRNEGAAARLRAAAGERNPLHVSGFVDDVERYVAAADLVVTKPGGLTTSEVLALGRPLLLTRPIPGQEEGNARVLCASDAARVAPDPAAVTAQVEELFTRRGALGALAIAAAARGRPDAARSIAASVRRAYLGRPALFHAERRGPLGTLHPIGPRQHHA